MTPSLEDDFFGSDALLRICDRDLAAEAAAAEFRQRHPDVDEDVVLELARRYRDQRL